jgi:hypothetical protein
MPSCCASFLGLSGAEMRLGPGFSAASNLVVTVKSNSTKTSVDEVDDDFWARSIGTSCSRRMASQKGQAGRLIMTIATSLPLRSWVSHGSQAVGDGRSKRFKSLRKWLTVRL